MQSYPVHPALHLEAVAGIVAMPCRVEEIAGDVVVPRKLKRKRLRAPIGHEPKIDGVGLVEMVAQHRAARDVEVLRSRLSQRRVPEEEDPDDETGIGGRT